jgi:diaminopropionate ammonia-lyase
VIVVEPARADCIYRSITAGRPTVVPGEIDTFMACLAAGEVSPVAWPILQLAVDDVLTLPDEAAPAAMRLLASGTGGDRPIVAGESGCAAIAGLLAVALDPALREAIGLDGQSRVAAIVSEGATDPATYTRVVGRRAEDVAAVGR